MNDSRGTNSNHPSLVSLGRSCERTPITRRKVGEKGRSDPAVGGRNGLATDRHRATFGTLVYLGRAVNLRRQVVYCGWALLLLSLLNCNSALGESSPSFEIVRASYLEYVTSLQTLRVKFTSQSEMLFDVKQTLNVEGEQMFPSQKGASTGMWMESGVRQVLHTENVHPSPGTRKWTSYDGRLGYDYSINGDTPGIPLTGQMMPRVPESLAGNPISAILGRTVYESSASLPDLFARGVGVVGQTDTLFGRPCVVIDFGTEIIPSEPLGLNRLRAWIDVEDGGLLRQVVVTPTRFETGPASDRNLLGLALPKTRTGQLRQPTVKALPTERIRWMRVTSVQQVADSARGVPRRFPKVVEFSVSLEKGSTTLDEVAVNEPIDASQFVPNIPRGMQLTDESQRAADGFPTVKYSGGAEGREEWQRKAEAVSKARAAARRPPPGSLDATPRPPNSMRWFLGVGLALLCSATVFVVWRRS